MEEIVSPFEFKQCISVLKSTGKKAKNLRELRDVIAGIREAMSGDEFCFNETMTLIFPVGIRAKNLAEFLMAVKYVPMLICYHFHKAKMVYL